MSKEEIVSLKVLMSAIDYALGQLAQVDENIKNELKDMNESIQWKIGELAFNTVIKDGKSTLSEGTISDPTLTLEISDVGTALEAFTGKVQMNKLGDKLNLKGDASKFQKLIKAMETLRNYLEEE